MWPIISVSLISFVVATLGVGWLASNPALQLAIDEPNARSLHTTPVPRTGGIGLLLGIAAGWTLITPAMPWTFWLATSVVIAISLLDDLRGLSAAVRLAAHLFAAALVALALLGSESPLLLLLVILAIGWMCNLYNFMDGSDGLAGGMAIFGFVTYATAAWLSGSTQFALLNLAVAAAAAGFLVHNFHPARIFLGDTGSVPLGFLAAAFGLIGWINGHWPWWFPPLVFSPFIVDASATLVRRLLSRARVWEAHRDHYYQRLVRIGLGHRNTALAEYVLMAACGIAGLLAMRLTPTSQLAALGAIAAVYLMLIAAIELVWRRKTSPNA